MLNPRDKPILRQGLVQLGVGVALALVLVIPSQFYLIAENEHVQAKRRAMLAAQTRLSTAQEATQIIAQYLPRFERYRAEGAIGEEHRLSWIDALRSWTVKRGLDAAQYSIDTRRVWPLSMIPASNEMEVRRSEMQTAINVLHEGDLIELWEHLNRHGEGLFAVKECELRRIIDEIDITSTQPTLSSRCLIQWLTVDTPGAQTGGV